MLNKAILGSRPTFRITVSAGPGGTASVNKQYAAEGETVTISISPYSNYVIGSVSVPGVSVSGSGYTRTFVMPSKAVTVSVSFSYVAPSYSISISAGTGGTASLSTYSATAGSRVYIYVSPSTGYEVASVSASGVSVSGSGTTYYFTMPSRSVSVSVSFQLYATHTGTVKKEYYGGRYAFSADVGRPDWIQLFVYVDNPKKVYCLFTNHGINRGKRKVTRLDSGLSVLCTTNEIDDYTAFTGYSDSDFFTENDIGKTIRFAIQSI